VAQHKFAAQYMCSGSVIYAFEVCQTMKRAKVEKTGKQLGGLSAVRKKEQSTQAKESGAAKAYKKR